ncbi:MAG: hypothetical protein ABIS36_22940 [Chryseolinea sp.]
MVVFDGKVTELRFFAQGYACGSRFNCGLLLEAATSGLENSYPGDWFTCFKFSIIFLVPHNITTSARSVSVSKSFLG